MAAWFLSHVRLCASPWTAARQAPLSTRFPNPGVTCHFLLQGIFQPQGLNARLPSLLLWQAGLCHGASLDTDGEAWDQKRGVPPRCPCSAQRLGEPATPVRRDGPPAEALRAASSLPEQTAGHAHGRSRPRGHGPLSSNSSAKWIQTAFSAPLLSGQVG